MGSIGESAALGLQSGIQLAMGLRNQQRAEEQQGLQNQRQATQDARSQQRQDVADAQAKQAFDLRTLDQHQAQLDGEGNEHMRVKPDFRSARNYVRKQQALDQARQDVLAGKGNTYNPSGVSAKAQAGLDALQRNDLDYFKSNPGAFTEAFEVSGFSPTEMAPGGVGEQALKDVTEGLQSGDAARALKGANFAFRGELNHGIGSKTAHGGTKVGAALENVLPDPRDPGRSVLSLRVYENNGKEEASGDEIRARRAIDPHAPAGATGHYVAPLTERRSADKDDPVKSVANDAMVDRVAKLTQLAQLAASPQAQQLIEQDSTAKWDDSQLDATWARRGIKKPLPHVTTTQQAPGSWALQQSTDPTTGAVTTTQFKGPPKLTDLEQLQAFADEQGISREKAASLRHPSKAANAAAGVPTGGGLAGGGGGGGPGLKDREQTRKEAKDVADRADKAATAAERAAADAQTKLHQLDSKIGGVMYFGATKLPDGRTQAAADAAERKQLQQEIKDKDELAVKARKRHASLSDDLDKPEDAPAAAPVKFDRNGAKVQPPAAKGPPVLKFDKNGNRVSA